MARIVGKAKTLVFHFLEGRIFMAQLYFVVSLVCKAHLIQDALRQSWWLFLVSHQRPESQVKPSSQILLVGQVHVRMELMSTDLNLFSLFSVRKT